MIRLGGLRGDRRWLWAAAAGLLVYLFVQVFPLAGGMFAAPSGSPLTREEGERQAYAVARERFGLEADEIRELKLTHLSDSPAVAYISKHGLFAEYDEKWSSAYPTDYYLAELALGGRETLKLRLDLGTGKLVAWTHTSGTARDDGEKAAEGAEADPAATAEAGMRFAAQWGVDPTEWEFDGATYDGEWLLYDFRGDGLADARLTMQIKLPASYDPSAGAPLAWKDGSVVYWIKLPSSFTAYLDNQESLAMQLSSVGYLLPHVLMFILAIVYAAVLARHTSFLRGIFLAAMFLALYAVLTVNMIPALHSQILELGYESGGADSTVVLLVTTLFLYAGMALLTYMSAVAGDGLWKSMGRPLWPRWREPEYGQTVLASMKEGYFLAFILLGVQSVILLVLEKTIGAFYSSDPSQSLLNMHYTWLLPLLAICAGISEEIQSRFFGIGLFRKWLTDAARGILRREPSRRTTLALTFCAMLPPGLFWALGHVGYAIYPVYTRIIELMIIAVLFGWFMLRFGLMTAIFAHIAFNAILMGQQLMLDGLPGDELGGVASLLLPAAIGVAIWGLHRLLRAPRTAQL